MTEVELIFKIAGTDGVMSYFTDIGGRPGALLAAQPDNVKEQVRGFVDSAIEPSATRDGLRRVPLTAVLVPARS